MTTSRHMRDLPSLRGLILLSVIEILPL